VTAGVRANQGSGQHQDAYGFSTVQMSFSSELSAEEVRAAALSDYILKSPAEKLKAIAKVERKKNAEIDILKQEMAELRLNPGQTSTLAPFPSPQQIHKDVADMSREELVAKLVKYQNYMQKYMVVAQEEKRRAVIAAQEEAKKKWEEAMLRLQPAATAAPVTTTATASPLYMARNAAVSKAAAAGKSRWGGMEVQRVARSSGAVNTVSTATPPPSPTKTPEKPRILPSTVATFNGAAAPTKISAPTVSSPPEVVTVPPEVEAADHGLRANGHVGGLTLAERVAQGAMADNIGAKIVVSASTPVAASVVAPPALSSRNEVLYTQRNINVLAAAKAGKSRWGNQEIERVQSIVNSLPAGASAAAAVGASGAVINGAADPPALEERVNLGARMLANN